MDTGSLPPLRRERRERRTNRRLRSLGLFVVLLIGAVVWLIVIALRWNPVLDEHLCPTDRPIEEEVVVLIDATDRWNATQRAVIRQEFRSIQESVPRFGRIHLYTIRPLGDELPSPALRLCNPGLPSDFDEVPVVGEAGARAIANPAELEATWREGYSAKLDTILAREARRDAERTSPIMETLRSAAIEVFGVDDRSGDGRRTIHVFSDLLQNSPRYSVYGDPVWNADDGSSLADPGALGTGSLDEAQTHLYLLDRELVGAESGHERGALVRLWERYFAEQGATVMRVRRIEG